MDKKKVPGKKTGTVNGKGFYIALCLCAAVVGVSAWMLIAGAGANVEEENVKTVSLDVTDAVVTTLPAGGIPREEAAAAEIPAETGEAEEPEETQEPEAAQAVFSETVTAYVWPVRGGVEREYSTETLHYDSTMADWRTHDGIDIACDAGTQVIATAGGTVVSVSADDLYGTTVEIDHANGVHSVYANLAEQPTVSEGDVVTMGQTIGSVGQTALAETNMVPHLHFAMTKDGANVDPRSYLPEEWTE